METIGRKICPCALTIPSRSWWTYPVRPYQTSPSQTISDQSLPECLHIGLAEEPSLAAPFSNSLFCFPALDAALYKPNTCSLDDGLFYLLLLVLLHCTLYTVDSNDLKSALLSKQ
jgi:hypothetical protein